MERAARWFKGLFGIKTKVKERTTEYSSAADDRCRWSSSLCNNPKTIPPNITPAEAAWLRSFYSQDDKEQNKHAIAVAAATAAAADAAVAAAQAAVAVVRLTSQGFGGKRGMWAAVKIQSLFRGFLARKALRALKGLVKIQALVRGFLVRKEAAATLHSMQALIRAQASVRAEKMRLLQSKGESFLPKYQARIPLEDERSEHPSSFHGRRLSASFDNAVNSLDESPKIVEVDTGCRPKSRSRRANSTEDSLPSCRIPTPDEEWVEECHFSTAQSTPRFAGYCGCSGPITPARSACAESFLRSYGGNPSYMAKTQSFKAKLRSYSAPKQRPEPGPKRRLSLHEMMESRNSLSGATMQRSCSQAINFRNAIMGNFVRSSDFVRENNSKGKTF